MCNIHMVARAYTNAFYKFLCENEITASSCNIYELLSYCMKKLYAIESSEYNTEIRVYGDKCIKYLSKVKGIPSKLKEASFEDRVALVNCCKIYTVVLLQAQRNCNSNR